MVLDVLPVSRQSYRNGDFPCHHTHVLKISQDSGYQLFTGVADDLSVLSSYIIFLVCVRSVKIFSIDDYE